MLHSQDEFADPPTSSKVASQNLFVDPYICTVYPASSGSAYPAPVIFRPGACA